MSGGAQDRTETRYRSTCGSRGNQHSVQGTHKETARIQRRLVLRVTESSLNNALLVCHGTAGYVEAEWLDIRQTLNISTVSRHRYTHCVFALQKKRALNGVDKAKSTFHPRVH